ncbi:MAG: YgaP family membrane protein [Myxococcales bacterium]
MTVQRAVLAFAGSMVLLSLVLTRFVHPGFVWLTAFVGANMLQSAFTGFCPLAILLRKAGLQDGATWRQPMSP